MSNFLSVYKALTSAIESNPEMGELKANYTVLDTGQIVINIYPLNDDGVETCKSTKTDVRYGVRFCMLQPGHIKHSGSYHVASVGSGWLNEDADGE